MNSTPMVARGLQLWMRLLLFGAAYFLCAEVGHLLTSGSHAFVTFWLPAGLYVAVLVLNAPRSWPGFVAVAIAANFAFDMTNGQRLSVSLMFCAANSVEALTGAWLIRRFVSERMRLESLPEALGLLGWSAVLSTMAGATIGVSALVTPGASEAFVRTWLMWWTGALVGILLMAPLVLSWSVPVDWGKLRRPSWLTLEWCAVFFVTAGISWVTIGLDYREGFALKYLMLPLLGYSAVRFGIRGASINTLVLALFIAWHAGHAVSSGTGAMALTLEQRLIGSQAFIAVAAAGALLLASLVDERLRREQRLLQSEERYRQIVETASEGICTIDADQRISFVNPRFCEMLGFSEAEILGRTANLILPADEVPDHDAQVSRRRHGEAARYERRLIRKDGSEIWTFVSGSPLFDVQGRFRGSLGMVTDITERRRAEDALREQEARYRAVIETSADGFWVNDRHGRILEVNDAYVRRSGYSREELLSMRVSELEASERPEETAGHIEKVMRTGTDLFETRHRTKDGTVWQAEVDTAYWPIADGRLFVFVRDINRRNRSEALLRVRRGLADMAERVGLEELMQAALDEAELLTGSRIGFFHFIEADQENITLCAWSTNTLKRMCNAEGKGSHYPISEAGVWVDCFHARAPVIHNDYASLLHRRGLPQGHATIERLVAVPVIRDDAVVAIFGVGNKTSDYTQDDVEAVQSLASMVMDLVARRRAEENLRTSLREKETLLREIHHRVKNNLQLVSSLLDLQAGQVGDTAARAALLDTQNRVRSIALHHEALHRLGNLSQVDLAAYAETLVTQLLHSVSGKAGHVRMNCRVTPLRLSLDQAIPCGLIINELVTNSLKHAFPDGREGEITVELRAEEAPMACLVVGDDGIGPPADFDVVRANSLGLQLVSDLVGQLGGNLQLRSGPGMVVEIKFPLTPNH